jgi:catalase
MWYNAKGQYWWIKIHFKTEQGIKTLTRQEASRLVGEDPDHATRDLSEAIKRGEFPAWKAYVQIMTPDQAKSYRFDPFDITKVWPHKDFPLLPFGRLVLDRNPSNYFADVEQAAFSPGNFVPGIGPSPDRLLQGRLFSYHDTHRHRLGTNYHLIPVNMPKAAAELSYQRDGFMRTDLNGGDGPNYWPNTFGGPQPDPTVAPPPIDVAGIAARHVYRSGDVDFVQAGELYGKVMNDEQRAHLIDNLVSHMRGAQKQLQLRQTALFYKANPEYGERVAKGLALSQDEVKRLAAMTQEERVKETLR